MKPLVIGSAKNTRCFRVVTVENLGFDYQCSKKSWMNKEIFFDWFKRFDQYIAKSQGRRGALVMIMHRTMEPPKTYHAAAR